jgi:hypothetical protein
MTAGIVTVTSVPWCNGLSPKAIDKEWIGPADIAHGARDAVERDGLQGRIVARREVTLDAVRERIHAGRGGETRRERKRQLRVAESHVRACMHAAKAQGWRVRLRMDAAAEGDLRTGAGGGRNRDQRHQVALNERRVQQVVDEAAALAREDPQGLAGIEHRAAANRDDAIAGTRAVGQQGTVHAGDGGVFRNAVEHARRRSAAAGCADALGHAETGQPGIREDQRAHDAATLEFAGEFGQHAVAEVHVGQAGKQCHR